MAQLTRIFRHRKTSATVDGPFAFQVASPDAVTRRRVRLFALLGLGAYALALIATLPAELLMKDAEEDALVGTVTGTVWSGEASMNGGHGLKWAWSPFASLRSFSFSIDFQMSGPDTDLRGQARWRPNSFELRNVGGRSTGALISAIFPQLPLTCDFPMQVDVGKVILGEGNAAVEGEIRSDRGLCVNRGGIAGTSTMPPLLAQSASTVAGSTGSISVVGNVRERIASIKITPNGELSLKVLPRGAALLSGGVGSDMTITTKL